MPVATPTEQTPQNTANRAAVVGGQPEKAKPPGLAIGLLAGGGALALGGIGCLAGAWGDVTAGEQCGSDICEWDHSRGSRTSPQWCRHSADCDGRGDGYRWSGDMAGLGETISGAIRLVDFRRCVAELLTAAQLQ